MKIVAAVLLTVVFALIEATDVRATRYITIGTGSVTGVYYPTGGAICRMVNKTRPEHDIRCAVESTGGSVYNLNTIAAGGLEMGIAQSDWQYHAYHGSNIFAEQGPNKDLRSIFSIHSEPFTLVVRADSGIKDFQGIKGKRVNIGNPGSGQRGTMEVLMKAMDIKLSELKSISEVKAAEQSRALCANEIDAMVYTVGHPNGSIKEATSSCDAILINVTGPAVDKLVAENDYYRTAVIPGGMYHGMPTDIRTFGVGATLVTSAQVPEEVIYHVVKAVFENFEDFKKLHPAFADLKKEEMIREGLTAPLHPGAIRYYKEVGLM